MTTKQRTIKRLSFELSVWSGRCAHIVRSTATCCIAKWLWASKTEVLCVAYTYTSTFATQSARTTPYLSLMRGYTTMLCATALLSNPYGLALIRLCKHTHFTITALCAYDPPHLHHKKTSRHKLLVFFCLCQKVWGGCTTILLKFCLACCKIKKKVFKDYCVFAVAPYQEIYDKKYVQQHSRVDWRWQRFLS